MRITRGGCCRLVIVAVVALSAGGCGRDAPRGRSPLRLDVSVFADTGRGGRLHVEPPPDTVARPASARVWLAHVAPARPAAIDTPLPEPAPGVVEGDFPAPPALEVDPDLKPPILRAPASLRAPRGRRGRVELDVRVAEDGSVSDALWAGGSPDTALVAAAVECALAMRFYPALRAGSPVAVWCRQRFDFEGR